VHTHLEPAHGEHLVLERRVRMLGIHTRADAIDVHAHAVGRRHERVAVADHAAQHALDDARLVLARQAGRVRQQAVALAVEAEVGGQVRDHGLGRAVAIAIGEALERRLGSHERLVHGRDARARARRSDGSRDQQQRETRE
jgi:hypothetical protein